MGDEALTIIPKELLKEYVGKIVIVELLPYGGWNPRFIDTYGRKPVGVIKIHGAHYLTIVLTEANSEYDFALGSYGSTWQCRDMHSVTWTNRGKEHCIICKCRTEMKRDFSDMSVREMCPRCKL